ncbi:MAG TPA: ABC transporter permease [Terriglobales bacterium]|nr:ABC transporter permease [Terriglobales bacterium]
MQWREGIKFALWALSADKLKATLTMLGVIIGSSAIVLVVTIVSTGKEYISSQIQGVGANIAFASLVRGETTRQEDELTPEDMQALRETIPSVKAAAGTYDMPADYQAGDRTRRARLVGVTEEFQTIRNLKITSGRYFDDEDFTSRSKVCLVTDRIAELAFRGDPPLGNEMRLDQFRCTIIGTFRESIPTFGQSEIQNETVLIPFPLVRSITGDNFFQVMYVQASSPEQVPTMTEEMRRLLHTRHRPETPYSIDNLSSLLETAKDVSFAMSMVLLCIAILTLITAGTGIMNIMLVNVSQRTKEIGVRKALGARPSEIRLQFLLEAGFISFAGALVGVVIAVALTYSVSDLIESSVAIDIPWAGVTVALLLATGVGVLFGYWPASSAAKLDPILAMRTD